MEIWNNGIFYTKVFGDLICVVIEFYFFFNISPIFKSLNVCNLKSYRKYFNLL